MKRTITFAVFALPILFAGAVRAELIVYEGFDYGASDGSIAGQNGGIGFGGAWTVVQSQFATGGSYRADGLTFGSNFLTSGGTAVVYGGGSYNEVQRTTDYRPLGVNQTGTIYGSFLFNIQADGTYNSAHEGINALLIGPTPNESLSAYDFGTNEFATNNSAARGPGTPGYPSYLSGTAPSLNTTYLYLFKLTNVGGAGETTDAWVLTQDQYDNFKTAGSSPGELLETDLNAAVLGTGGMNVMERGSFSGSGTGTFSTSDFLTLFGFSTQNPDHRLTSLMDEIRISNVSLSEVSPSFTAVPEPSSFALVALISGGAWWKRRRSAPTVTHRECTA